MSCKYFFCLLARFWPTLLDFDWKANHSFFFRRILALHIFFSARCILFLTFSFAFIRPILFLSFSKFLNFLTYSTSHFFLDNDIWDDHRQWWDWSSIELEIAHWNYPGILLNWYKAQIFLISKILFSRDFDFQQTIDKSK